MLRYIKEAPLEKSSAWAAQVAAGLQLKDMQGRMLKELCDGPRAMKPLEASACFRPALEDLEREMTGRMISVETSWTSIIVKVSEWVAAVEMRPWE